ncbi:MAG: ribosome maturation factor RimP [Gammaproteobacteria bacterium]
MNATREQLIGLLEPTVEALGYELADLEVNLGHSKGLVRIFIDSQQGITLDDCERVSHQVSGVLDVEDLIAGNYNLEVSSPGADRKLVKPEHFDRFAGCTVKVRLKRLVDGRRRISGQLLGRDDAKIQLRVGDKDIWVALAEIEVARVVPDWQEFVRAGRG